MFKTQESHSFSYHVIDVVRDLYIMLSKTRDLAPSFKGGRICLFYLMLINSAFATPSYAASSKSQSIPPSWKTRRSTSRPQAQPYSRPWYKPKIALGGGLHFPEVIPLEAFFLFGDYAGIRLFFAPEYPFHARVDMPSDVISTKRGLGVANPEFTINLDVHYGPQYGFELLSFPFGESFFVGGGFSIRKIQVDGVAQSNILICSLIEAAKNPPCGDPNARLETQTELRIAAHVESEAQLGRLVLGGFWHIGTSGYFALTSGLTLPISSNRSSIIEASLDTAASTEPEITGALAEIKREKEIELSQKALKEMRPVDERVIPLLGFSLGIRL